MDLLPASSPSLLQRIRAGRKAASGVDDAVLAARLEVHSPRWPHPGTASSSSGLRLKDRPAPGAEPCLVLPLRPLGGGVPHRLCAPGPEACDAARATTLTIVENIR